MHTSWSATYTLVKDTGISIQLAQLTIHLFKSVELEVEVAEAEDQPQGISYLEMFKSVDSHSGSHTYSIGQSNDFQSFN